MKMFLLFWYFLSFIHFSKNEKLIFASLHSRHGARAPLNCDDNRIDYLGEEWTNPGELTSTGQRMEYILGLRNRQRYITGNKYQFLSEQYDPHEILVYSTNVNRTILSITSQLQGLYPMYSRSGYNLTQEQIDVSIPPINISYNEIQKEIENLNSSALPNFMTVIPIHTLSAEEKKMNVPDSTGCNEKVNKTRDNNKFKNDKIIQAAKNFNNKYSKKLHNYYDKNPENFTYDFDWIGLFCDTMISDYSDGRKMEDFLKRTTINGTELLEDCRQIVLINFREDFYGDKDNAVILISESKLIKEVLHYMKLKIDEDLQDKNNALNVSDYSKPKMLIYSGHDSTLTAEELFMIKYFGLKVENYIYPTYSTQLAFEVTRGDTKPQDYSGYKVTFYFNDEALIVKTFDEFEKIINEKTWNEQKVKEFCEGKENKINSINFQLYIIIGLSALAFILFIVIIVLAVKLKKKNYKGELGSDDNDKNDGMINEEEN